ncbi:hypothetical protein NFHSH190041_00630 [Shewanella sp. NFH-SH190041]|uniref:hypothetical protein n=1 Tax=Shewanella sp. NFH-SH190041 TaxID=2950245 RepID=UPI0021C3D132|nr:hypothetical protein [Shewanella sp. NFH-SH190041]BDM62611.1 hypothetical protein NFHSH190041_00630 [Shewanella sp. NFH-SH190041]
MPVKSITIAPRSRFTLTEIVMVLIIIVSLAILLLPKLSTPNIQGRQNDLLSLAASLNDASDILHGKALLEGKLASQASRIDGVNMRYGYPTPNYQGIYRTLPVPQLWHVYTGDNLLRGVAVFTDKPIDPVYRDNSDTAVLAAMQRHCFVLYNWPKHKHRISHNLLANGSWLPKWLHDDTAAQFCASLTEANLGKFIPMCRLPGFTPPQGIVKGTNALVPMRSPQRKPEILAEVQGC